MQSLIMMVSNPLLIVRELGEALFELLKFTDFVGIVRCLHQFDIFGRFGARAVSLDTFPERPVPGDWTGSRLRGSD